jgi:D-lactate dehydrogenase
MDLGRKMDHHVAMTVGDFDGSLDRFLKRLEDFREENGENAIVHECTSKSQKSSLDAFRFVAAPAFRTWCVGQAVQGFSVDYALPKNGGQTPSLSSVAPLKRMRYSHFGCNVVHEDLAYAPGVDIHAVKMQLKKSVEHECGGKLPAEHGHGTEYHAPEKTRQRWKDMDPLNVMNPGIGGLSSKYRYEE